MRILFPPNIANYIKEVNGAFMYPMIIEIGAWDLQAHGTITIAHGLGANFRKIRQLSVIIRADNDNVYRNLELNNASGAGTYSAGSITYFDSLFVALQRATGLTFDKVGYSSEAINRGWILIWFVQ